MTPQEFAAKMREIFHTKNGEPRYDPEQAHIQADKLLGDLLAELGYGDGVAIFQKGTKWYS